MAVTRRSSVSKKRASVLEDARRTGLLDGDKSEHVEAQPDPVAA